MRNHLNKGSLVTSLACTALFAFVVAACGGTRIVISSDRGFASTIPFVFATGTPGNRLLPSGAKILSSATFWQTGGTGVGQSMNAACDLGFDTSTANGQFIPISTRGSSTCNGSVLAPQNGVSQALTNRVIDSGTITAMTVIFSNAVNGSRVSLFDSNGNSLGVTCSASGSDRCDVRNAAVPVTNDLRIVAYLIPAAGDTITHVDVYISKI